MDVQVEKLKKNMTKLAIKLSAEQFGDIMKRALNKSKNKFNIPGFRKGKTSRAMIKKMYSGGIFYEEAADEAANAICIEAMNESGLGIVSKPEVVVEQIGEDKPFICTATVAIRSEVTLGEYKDIEIEKADAAVKSEGAEVKLKKAQERNAGPLTVEDGPVANGDRTAIDLERFVDNKAFDDGKAIDYPLTVGSHSFTDTFEGQPVGKNIGEECRVSTTFPEEYHAAELAGKLATSRVIVKEIKVKELPGLDSELAGEVSEFDTPGEHKKDTEAKTLEREQKEAASENESRVVDKVVAGAPMETLDGMVEGQIDNMIQDTARCMESQGLSMGPYMRCTDMTMEQIREQVKPQTLKRIQTRPVLKGVVKAGDLQVPDGRLGEEVTKMAVVYRMEADKLKGHTSGRDKDQVKEGIAAQEAVDFLVTEVKLV